ncbi:MAG: hypothetical protein AUJ57_04305 [Zetaproteobacteria bacterium CG1_02_53_45]|nr:MAG: hypothetical protein AUJ57_04305 [Zetaproteobacteria bacterium CG1_02_53_45]
MSQSGKERIVAAARQRFSHYGYSKTTMAEIAADCRMSVGNLYRFYDNKEEIAVEGARGCLILKAEVSEKAVAVAAAGMDALRAYFITRLRHMHAFVLETPHMYELVQLISGKHADLLVQFEQRAIAVLETILLAGIAAGEFRMFDARQRAADLFHACNKYNMPICMSDPVESLEAELNSLLDLLYDGLRALDG